MAQRAIGAKSQRDDDADTSKPVQPATTTPEALAGMLCPLGGPTERCAPLPFKAFTYFSQRYFSQFIARNVRGVEGHNLRLQLHTNGLLVIGLDASHVLLQPLADPNAAADQHLLIDFDVKRDRQGNVKDRRADTAKISGKHKKGALVLQRETTLCVLDTEARRAAAQAAADEANRKMREDPAAHPPLHDKFQHRTAASPYKVPAVVNGVLLELNPRLADDPSLLWRAPLTAGYIAVSNPRATERFDGFELVSQRTYLDDGDAAD